MLHLLPFCGRQGAAGGVPNTWFLGGYAVGEEYDPMKQEYWCEPGDIFLQETSLDYELSVVGV
ncbi:MAG: hypothetical protein MK165_19030 [Pirellulaceae bacterium]|nr:hypothetical protein [Pirellulaceae bacterium]